MTENEAKGWLIELKDCEETQEFYYADCIIEAFDTAIQALEEIQQYRAIGTVEDIQSMKDNGAFSGVELAQLAVMQMRLRDYQAIGTIEEFKALKEKNEPKRLLTREEKYPQNYGIYSTADRWCPYCRGLVFTSDWSVYKQNIMYKRTRCGCGQKLDWQ